MTDIDDDDQNDVAAWTEDDEDLQDFLSFSGPFFDHAMRRFAEGANVSEVAEETGAPRLRISNLYVVHRWWIDADKRLFHSPFDVRDALIADMFEQGATVEQVVAALGVERWETLHIHQSWIKIARLEAGKRVATQAHRRIYRWLRARKDQGATRAEVIRRAIGGETETKAVREFQCADRHRLDVWDASRAVILTVADDPDPRQTAWWQVHVYRGCEPLASVGLFEKASERPRPCAPLLDPISRINRGKDRTRLRLVAWWQRSRRRRSS